MNHQMDPMTGINSKRSHHADLSRSCNRFTATASDGQTNATKTIPNEVFRTGSAAGAALATIPSKRMKVANGSTNRNQ